MKTLRLGYAQNTRNAIPEIWKTNLFLLMACLILPMLALIYLNRVHAPGPIGLAMIMAYWCSTFAHVMREQTKVYWWHFSPLMGSYVAIPGFF